MKPHLLGVNKRKKKAKRLGRGYSSGKGSTSGRGNKGEKARAGHRIPKGFEGGQTKLSRRIPKMRGFNNKWKITYLALKIEKLNALEENSKVTLELLKEKKLISKNTANVKIVGGGILTKKLTFVNIPVTSGAKQEIEKAGGEILGK